MNPRKQNPILDLVQKNTRQDDDAQELPDAIVNGLKPKGYFSLLLPKNYGGAQMDYPAYIELVMAIARRDGSTAWCVNQGSALASLARLLQPEVGREIWPDAGVVLSNGPPGNASSVEQDDGFLLSGSWSFSSGIAHADWLIGLSSTRLLDGSKAARWHLFPKASADIDDAWDVAGLRRTGSYGFSVNELKVPKTHVFEYAVRKEDPAIYQIPLNLLFAGGFAAVALGVARSAIDFTIERCKTKIRRFERTTMEQGTATQDVIGRAEATWQAASSFLNTTVDHIWQVTNEEGYCPTDEKYQLRLAATHGIRQAKIATDLVYDLCSTDSIFQQAAIHRHFQDIHVISQHLQGRPEIYSVVGRHKLGLPAQSFLVD